MTQSLDLLITQVREANRKAERAYWWLKRVDMDAANAAGTASVAGKIKEALAILNRFDALTIDIINQLLCQQ